jgi:hypothetical protein
VTPLNNRAWGDNRHKHAPNAAPSPPWSWKSQGACWPLYQAAVPSSLLGVSAVHLHLQTDSGFICTSITITALEFAISKGKLPNPLPLECLAELFD